MMPLQPASSIGAAGRPSRLIPRLTAYTRTLIFDIRDVNFAEQVYEADLDIELRVPGIRELVAEEFGADPESDDTSAWPDIWRLERKLWIRNAVSETRVERWYDPGKATFRLRFLGKLSMRARLEAFPFDVCKLPIEFSVARPASDVCFQLRESRLLLRPDCSVRSLFDISPVMTHTVCQTDADESASGVQYALQTTFVSAKRRSGYFVWNSLLPPVLIAVLATCAAPLGVADLASRLEIVLALLVAIVGFKQGQAPVLPVLPYNTLGDLSLNLQYGGLALASALSVTSFLRGCHPLSAAAAAAHALTVAPMCAVADAAAGLAGVGPGCVPLGFGPLPGPGTGAEHGPASCPNALGARHADAVLWTAWAVLIGSLNVFIVVQAVLSRAWATLGPEWALKLASEQDADELSRLALIQAGNGEDGEDGEERQGARAAGAASPGEGRAGGRAGTGATPAGVQAAGACAGCGPCGAGGCASLYDAELAEVRAEDQLRKQLHRLRREASGGMPSIGALGAADLDARSVVVSRQLEQQIGGRECGACDLLCACISRDWLTPDRAVDAAAKAWNRARVWRLADAGVAGRRAPRCCDSQGHCCACVGSAVASACCWLTRVPALAGARLLSRRACIPIRARMHHELLGFPWDGVMDAIEGRSVRTRLMSEAERVSRARSVRVALSQSPAARGRAGAALQSNERVITWLAAQGDEVPAARSPGQGDEVPVARSPGQGDEVPAARSLAEGGRQLAASGLGQGHTVPAATPPPGTGDGPASTVKRRRRTRRP